MKKINWPRLALKGFAAFVLAFTSDSVIAAIKNEPNAFTPVNLYVLGIILLGAFGQAAIAVDSLLSNGFVEKTEKAAEPTVTP